jgi:hypothetical protein
MAQLVLGDLLELLELKILLYQWHVLLTNTKVLTC